MKQLITAVILTATAVTAHAQSKSPTLEQVAYQKVAVDAINAGNLAMKYKDFSSVCGHYSIAKQALLQAGDEKNYVTITKLEKMACKLASDQSGL
jgi:hypothetical protein